jgi:transcriptional regulator with XRE-family HTH domain
METTINQRIREIMDENGLNVTSFSKKVDLTQSTIDGMMKRGTQPSFDTILKIINAFPLISLKWLMLGKGEMNNNEELEKGCNNKDTSIPIEILRILECQSKTIELNAKTINAQQRVIENLSRQ